MIQRIQSIFLFFSSVSTGMLLLQPFLKITNPGGEPGLMYSNTINLTGAGESILPSLPLFFLICLITMISLVTIFLYKKRVLQMRLTVYNMILMLGLYGLGYYYASQAAKELSGEMQLMFFSVMPIIAFILSYLGWRGIRKDYLMLKAVDRIR